MLPITGDTDELLNSSRQRPASKKLHDAKQFLREQLEGKEPIDSETIMRLAEGRGLSRYQVLEAKRELGIDARKRGFSGAWVWVFPSGSSHQPSLIPA